MKTGSRLAFLVFIVVAIAHLLRLVFGVDVLIGTWPAPLWLSVLGVAIPGLIAWMLWREAG